MICLIIAIYNVCRYGSCCPPSINAGGGCCGGGAGCGGGGCCGCICTPCCVVQPTADSIVKPSPIIVQSPSYGSYVSRGTRLNQGSYAVAPRSIRAGTIPSRRNSIIVVQNTLPRRQVIQARPQIMIANGGRVPTIGRSSLMALPASSSSAYSQPVRCSSGNQPTMSSGNWNDDGDVRVIVRNQPYAASQRNIIIEAPPDIAPSCGSPPPAFENLTMQKTYGGGGGGGFDQSYGYGFSGQHSATIDVSFDQVPEYTLDDGIHQFQQTVVYPNLGEINFN